MPVVFDQNNDATAVDYRKEKEKQMGLMDDFNNDSPTTASPEESALVDFSEGTFEGTYEEETLPAGTEAKLRIRDAKFGESSKNPGSKYWQLTLEPVEHPRAKLITTWVNLVGPNDDERKRNNKLKAMEKFARCFGLFGKQLKFQDTVGLEGWAILGVQAAEGNFPEKNTIDKWVIPAA